MNLKKNIHDFNNDFLSLDPIIQRYSITGPLLDTSNFMDELWTRIYKIYNNANNEEIASDNSFFINDPHELSSYFSTLDFMSVLKKIRPIIHTHLYHAIMNLQTKNASIDELLNLNVFKSKKTYDNPDYVNANREETEPRKIINSSRARYISIIKSHAQTSIFVPPSNPYFSFIPYIYGSIYPNEKTTSGTINAMFPELILLFRLFPKYMPGHSDATPGFKYIDTLKNRLIKMQEDLSLTETQKLLFNYEIDTWFGISRLYSSAEYLIDLISSYKSSDNILNTIKEFGDCFKLLYGLPMPLHKIYGKVLVKAIKNLQKSKKLYDSEKEKALIPLKSILKEMIIINDILIPEITTFLAHNLFIQFLQPLDGFIRYDNQYIIRKFEKELTPDKSCNTYAIFNGDYSIFEYKNGNDLLSPNFLNYIKETLFSALVPANNSPMQKYPYLNEGKNSRILHINKIIEIIIDQKEFLSLT